MEDSMKRIAVVLAWWIMAGVPFPNDPKIASDYRMVGPFPTRAYCETVVTSMDAWDCAAGPCPPISYVVVNGHIVPTRSDPKQDACFEIK
jgi:hypothetical protein